MKKYLLNLSIALLMLLAAISVNAQTRTATASGNWNSTTTWGGASAPTSANEVVINNGVTVTVNVAAAACNSVTFRSASGTLTVSSGMTLTVTAGITLENTAGGNTAATLAGAGTINCASITVGGNVTAVTGNNLTNTLTSSVAVLSVSGGVFVNGEDNGNDESSGTFLLSTGTLSVGGVITLNSDTDDNDASAIFSMDSGTDNGVLTVTNATPFSLTGAGTETLNFTTAGTTTVNYAGTAQTVAPATYRNLVFSGSGAKTSGGTVTVGVKLSLQDAATAGSAITFNTAILEYKGTAPQTTSNNEFAASTSSIDEVIIDNAAGVTLNGAKTLNGDLTLASGNLTTGTNLSMANNTTITRSEGSLTGTLQGGGNYSVDYIGNSKTTGAELSGTDLTNLTVDLTPGQIVTLDQNRAPDGSLDVSAGIFDLSSFTINRSGGGGTLTVSNGATLRIGGTNGFPANYNTHAIGSTSPFSTVEYAGTAQTIATLNSTQSYGILILSGSGVKTFTGETVNGVLSVQGAATTAGTSPGYAATAILEYKGSVPQNTSSVEFVGTGANPANLRIDNTNGVTLHAAKSINGALTLTDGYLTTTNTFLLTINNGGSASTTNGAFVNGPLSKVKNTTARFDFPVGTLTGGLRIIGVTPQNTTSTTYRATFNSANPRTSVTNGTNLGTIQQISSCEYWSLSQTSGTTAARITLSWPAAVNSCGAGSYVGNITSLVVAQHNNTNWTNGGQSGNSGSPSAGGTITSNNYLGTFSPFVLATTNVNQNPLPVMFADVKAFQKNNGVQIDWSNLTERDVVGYTIERSADGQNFTAIGQQSPRSNSNDKEMYTAFDAAPFAGVNFYRVKAQETTGKTIYSKSLKVDLAGKQAGFNLYPNPVNGGQVSVSMNVKPGQYTVKVMNSAGQQVYTQRLIHQGGSMTQTVELPSAVKSGVYNMMITGDNYRESKMFIVQ
ncbi:MAG: T9SS type A sorting domain-containing protein [Bacteroidota bacterium]